MNTPWIIWGIVGLLSFVALEADAFRHPERLNTLSRAMATMGSRFPLSIGLVMFVIGGLCVHFWWPFCPAFMAPGVGG